MGGGFPARCSHEGNPVWLCKYTDSLCVAVDRAALLKTNNTRRKMM